MDEKKKDIGAMWLHTAQSGTKYMSGVIEIDGVKHQIVMFKNGYKEKENHPDYKIYPSTPKGEQATKVTLPAESGEFPGDDIPF